MRLREAHVPILLWLPAALMLHVGGGTGASEMARTVAERASILKFSRGVRSHIVGEIEGANRPTEFEVLDDRSLEAESSAPGVADEVAPPSETDLPSIEDQKRNEPEPIADAAPVPSVKRPEEPAPTETSAPAARAAELPAVPAAPAGRLAVQNDPSLDRNQKDNPDASRIADHANRTDEETQSRHRSYDQNVPKPDGGGAAHASLDPQVGNSDTDARGHSVEAKGDGAPRAGTTTGANSEPRPIARSTEAPEPRVGREATPGDKGRAASEAGTGERMPEAVSSERGDYTLDPDGGDGRARGEERSGRRGKPGVGALDGMILPGRMPSRFSVDAHGLQDALGARQLRAEADHARNTRLDRHRGSLRGTDFQRYRAAIENYVPHVKEGNQTSLNAARVPFASYINRMHNQIHPIFADGFLASLDAHPDARLRNMKLVTHVEIVLEGRSGRVVTAGIVRPSGVTALELAALRAIEEAAPYGAAPAAIVSPDGRVYLHWEFYRDPYYACTSQFARPYLLKSSPPGSDEGPRPTLPVPQPTADPAQRTYGLR